MPVVSFEESFLEQAMQQITTPIDSAYKPLGNSSARECLSMLRRICKYATRLRLIRPMELEVALPKAIDKPPVPLSPAEQQRLYQYVQENPTPRKIGLLLGLELGLRIGEICGLQWGDFDLKLGTLKISRTVCRISCGNGHTKVVIQTPKTRTFRREIPLPKQLLMMLKKLHGNASYSTWFLSGNESKACWMVEFALAAGLKSRLRTRETPPFFAKNPSRPSNASKKWNKKKKPRIIRINEQF